MDNKRTLFLSYSSKQTALADKLEDMFEPTGVIENPQYAEAYNNRGIAKKRLGDTEGAHKDFNKAKELGLSKDIP